jgi:hypothetical protein
MYSSLFADARFGGYWIQPSPGVDSKLSWANDATPQGAQRSTHQPFAPQRNTPKKKKKKKFAVGIVCRCTLPMCLSVVNTPTDMQPFQLHGVVRISIARVFGVFVYQSGGYWGKFPPKVSARLLGDSGSFSLDAPYAFASVPGQPTS